jgi:hypothetical protein
MKWLVDRDSIKKPFELGSKLERYFSLGPDTVATVQTVAIGLSNFFGFSLRQFFKVVAFAFFLGKNQGLSDTQRVQLPSGNVGAYGLFRQTKKSRSFSG